MKIFSLQALLFSLLCAAGARAADRPNLVWVVSEDNSNYTVGAYGDPLARTPHIDRLAVDGIVFNHAYSTSAVCAPTRSSIITGRYASSLGTQHMRSQRPLPPDVKFFPEFLRAAGYFTTNNDKTDYNTSTPWATAWDENSRTAHWRHRAPGQPFFSIFNFGQSHEGMLHRRKQLVTDPTKVRVPAYLPDTPEVRADLAQYYDLVAEADAAIGKVLAELEADGLMEDTIIFYYGDHGGAVSRSKRFLYENGTNPPLVVRFPEKYRKLAFSPAGSRSDEIVNFIDLAPTVLSLAGIPLAPQLAGRAFAGSARTPAPEITFMFRDRMDERYDLARAATDGRYRYIRNYYPQQPWGQHLEYLWAQASMRDWAGLARTNKLNPLQAAFFAKKPAEELFDCLTDPDNVHNLAGDASVRPQLLRLRSALREHLLASRDTGFMPEPLMVQWAGQTSPALLARDEKRYPLGRMLEMLDRLQLNGAPDPIQLSAALKAPEALIRYWGCVAALGADELPDLTTLLSDSELVIQLAAAEAILRRVDDAAARALLEQGFAANQVEIRLFAVNVAARLPRTYVESWRPLLEKLDRPTAAQGADLYVARAVHELLNPSL